MLWCHSGPPLPLALPTPACAAGFHLAWLSRALLAVASSMLAGQNGNPALAWVVMASRRAQRCKPFMTCAWYEGSKNTLSF